MTRLWCGACPTVQLPRAATPKPFTLVMPYYENPDCFQRQLAHWATFPAAVRAALRVIVVDDGSPEPLVPPASTPVALRLFRIEEDRRWNWLAARNIGAHYAAEGWLLLTDMDHTVPVETAVAICETAHDPAVAYAFARREHTGVALAPHSASFLMTRALFWRVGGYDEALAGYYGTDGDYRRRLGATAAIHLLPDALVRYEYVGDSSTRRYARKQPEDGAVRGIIARRGPRWRPTVLSFPYHEIIDQQPISEKATIAPPPIGNSECR